MSCLAGPTRHASAIVFLTQVMKWAQQIDDHTGEKVSNYTLFGLREHLFLIHLSCKYQNRPILSCQKPNSELEEVNFTKIISPDAYQKVQGYSIPQTCTLHKKGLFYLCTMHPKVLCSLRIFHIVRPLRLCQNCNPRTFPEFQNCKGFCENLKAPSLKIIYFMKFVNALHLYFFTI